MKILEVATPWINVPPNGYGGTENIIHGLVETLVKKGHDVTLFATGYSKTSAKLESVFERGLSQMNVPWDATLPSLLHYHQAFKLAEKEAFDIVHVNMSVGPDICMWPFLSELKVPYVMTIHSIYPFDRFSYMDKYYVKYFAKDIPAVSISKSMENALPKGFKSAGVVYNGLDLDSHKFSAEPKGNYLTWLGKIVPDKGLHEGIMAALSSGEQFIFAGVMDNNSKLSFDYFETKISPYIDDKQIQFLGPADLKLKNKLLGGAKAFLNPIGWEEPFGMVMAESMACGTPVITFRRGAAPEVVKDGETGYVVDTVREMIQAIKKINNGEISREACRKRVEENFSGEANSNGYLAVYQKLIDQFENKNK